MNLAKPESPTPASDSAPLARILFVDDDQIICGLYAFVLERHGYAVATAENGEDALEQLAMEDFDLVITDRDLPVLDGATMILALRSAGSRVPVIVISDSLAFSTVPPGVAREVSAVLPKPARVAEVLAAVAHALEAGPAMEVTKNLRRCLC